MPTALQSAVDAAWEERGRIGPDTGGEARDAVEEALERLDRGEARVAEPDGSGGWEPCTNG